MSTYFTLQTPDGQARIETVKLNYTEFEQEQTVFRARSRLAKKEYDVGGETEKEAFFNLLKFMSEKRLAAIGG